MLTRPRSLAPAALILVIGLLVGLLAGCATGTPTAATDTTPAPGTAATQPAPVAGTPAATAAASNIKQWSTPPEMTIDPNKIYFATFKTDKGDVKVELFARSAPVTVNNFIFLAKEGFYDNTTFHRVMQDFMAQGGDPTGTGTGGPGYQFADEIDPSKQFDEPGYLAMANAGPDSNGSQFFITTVATPWLNGAHTIFGKVISGEDVVKSLTLRDPQANPTTPGDTLKTVEISEGSASLLPPPTPTPTPNPPTMQDGRPLAKVPVAEREGLYNAPPALVIDKTKKYSATITTTKGEIDVDLFADIAPQSVNSFVVLSRLGYYDDFPINFSQPDAFVLTGSPGGQPASDIGYTVPVEVSPTMTHTVGAMGLYYLRDKQASSGSQFYVALADLPEFDGTFTVIGKITQGIDVAKALQGPSAPAGDGTAEPPQVDKIVTIEIKEQ